MAKRYRRKRKRKDTISLNERSWKGIVNQCNTKHKQSAIKKEYVNWDKGSDGKKIENSE